MADKPRRKRKRAAAPSSRPPDFELIRAADVKPEKVEYLWLDRIPKGTLTLIGGRPGEGKSLFTNFLAAYVTKTRRKAVVMSNPEDGLTGVKVPRLIAAEADPRLIHFWPGKLRLPDDVELLEELVLFHKVELVTIDPVAKHIRGKDPATALEPLVAMCERTGCAAVGVHHVNKRMPKDAHPRDAFGGANGGWLGTARFAHVLGPCEAGEEESRFLAMVKANYGRDDRPSVEFFIGEVEVDLPDGDVSETGRLTFVNAKSKVTGYDVVQYGGGQGFRHQGAGGGEKMAAAIEFLTLLLMKGPSPAKTIYDKCAEVGVSKMTIRRASEDLEIVKQRVGFGPGSHLVWQLPPDHPLAKQIGNPVSSDVDEFLSELLGNDDG